jgi:hypothetical protein
MTAAKFNPVIFPVWGFALSNIAYIFIFMIMNDFCIILLCNRKRITDPEARVRFPALPKKKNCGSGTGSTQPREYN